MFGTALLGILGLAILLGFVRLARGPSLPDRAVALDFIASLVVGFTGVFAVVVDAPVFLDLGLVLALVGFLGTVAFARYIEKGGPPWYKS